GGDLHRRAVRGDPFGVPVQGSAAQVQSALVLERVPVAQVERGVPHEQAKDLAVGHVHRGLPGLREAVPDLSVRQRPLLVEAVDVGAGYHPGFALLQGAAQPDVPVREGEQGLAGGQVLQGQAVADQLPRVDLVAAALLGVLGGVAVLICAVLTVAVAHGSSLPVDWCSSGVSAGGPGTSTGGRDRVEPSGSLSRSARSSTTTSAPASASASAWSRRSTPITYPKSPARPAWTPEIASSMTTAAAGGTPSASAPARKV